jgi:cystathionine beta-synthase
LWEQTEGRITHLVAAAGTGGTITGAGRYLKERNPAIRIIAGDPVGSIFAEYHRTRQKGEGTPYKVEGIGNDKLPSTLDFEIIDEMHTITDREAFQMGRRLTREEGLFVGGSSGLIVTVAARLARQLNDASAYIVCFLPDTGERYLSKMYNEEWMRENQLLEPERFTVSEMIARKDGEAPALVAVEATTTVREALRLITTYDISQLPVCSANECIGSVAESGVMARIIENQGILDQPVSSIMENAFPVVDGELPVSRLGGLLTRQCPAVLVRRNGQLTGIITRYDMVRYLTVGA